MNNYYLCADCSAPGEVAECDFKAEFRDFALTNSAIAAHCLPQTRRGLLLTEACFSVTSAAACTVCWAPTSPMSAL